MKAAPVYAKESDLCAAFIRALPKDWTAYPETGGFDIVLVRADGFQVGVEAKLRLNAKVVSQAAENMRSVYVMRPGPDCRAVLVPESAMPADLVEVCRLLNITVVTLRTPHQYSAQKKPYISPSLPEMRDLSWRGDWEECAPAKRIELPDWIPDVVAGASAPSALTQWKVGAIKIAITLAKRGFVTRQDFAFFKISMSRWTQGGWIIKDGRGGWVAGQYLPDFRSQHPVNYPQIEADFAKWKAPDTAAGMKQEALL